MTFQFDSKDRIARNITDADGNKVGMVYRRPKGGYMLVDGEKREMRELPFSSFQGALDYFTREFKRWKKMKSI
jgi:hypothetical protein